jgi:Domain of unknown function (DUF4386)
MSNRAIGQIVGALLLAAFVCYGVGGALAGHAAGAALMLLNSVVVAAIGGLVFRLLRPSHLRTAAIYFSARLLEAVLLAVGVVLLVWMGSAEGNDVTYQIAMFSLGVGSLPFCRALLRDQLVPGWLAVWGFLGYLALAAGALLEVVGLPVGLVFAIPGGLFEVALGLILIARGFSEPARTPPATRLSEASHRLGVTA